MKFKKFIITACVALLALSSFLMGCNSSLSSEAYENIRETAYKIYLEDYPIMDSTEETTSSILSVHKVKTYKNGALLLEIHNDKLLSSLVVTDHYVGGSYLCTTNDASLDLFIYYNYDSEYKNGEFLTLQQAYDKELITKIDVQVLSWQLLWYD